MLIYNHEKELIGIDEKDLNILGFKNLAQLISESSDFADFFVKKPGFIHNFQHVHWIDFVNTASDVDTISEVILNIKGKQYQAELQIESIYLNDEPSLASFLIYLKNLRKFGEEIKITEIEIYNKISNPHHEEINQMDLEDEIIEVEDTNETNDEKFEENKIEPIQFQTDTTIMQEEDLEYLEKKDNNYIVDKNYNIEKEIIKEKEDDYIFDPAIASQELGLPVDLVEGFIQDFIKQANDFKSQLYNSLEEDDIENVKALSHKLKGVSANLRVDDIFEILSFIKTSQNKDVIKNSLDKVYKKIEKLSLRKEIEDNIFDTVIEKKEEPEILPKEIEIEKLSDDIFLDTAHDINNSENIDLILENEPEESLKTIEIMYDKDIVANKLGISSSNFEELFSDFIVEAKILSEAIHDAILENNSDSWTIESIKFKGMSDNLHLYECVSELDKIIKTNDKNIAQTSINKIDDAIKSISYV